MSRRTLDLATAALWASTAGSAVDETMRDIARVQERLDGDEASGDVLGYLAESMAALEEVRRRVDEVVRALTATAGAD